MKTKKLKAPKQRNPFVQHLTNRKQGAHVKSKKALRRDAKVELKREKDCFSKLAA